VVFIIVILIIIKLPSVENVLAPSTKASIGPSAHLRINHKVTKSLSVVLA